MPVGSAPLYSHTSTAITTVVILWDVSLCLYFLSVIEDTVSFKFGGVCVGIRVGLVLFFIFIFIFACFMCVLSLLFIRFRLFFFSMFKDQALFTMYQYVCIWKYYDIVVPALVLMVLNLSFDHDCKKGNHSNHRKPMF